MCNSFSVAEFHSVSVTHLSFSPLAGFSDQSMTFCSSLTKQQWVFCMGFRKEKAMDRSTLWYQCLAHSIFQSHFSLPRIMLNYSLRLPSLITAFSTISGELHIAITGPLMCLHLAVDQGKVHHRNGVPWQTKECHIHSLLHCPSTPQKPVAALCPVSFPGCQPNNDVTTRSSAHSSC